MKYLMVVEPLSEEDGGGYMAFFPDLPGCLSDGETPAEAAANAEDALVAWMSVAEEMGHEVPAPGSAAAEAERESQAMADALDELSSDLREARKKIAALEKAAGRGAWMRVRPSGRFVAA